MVLIDRSVTGGAKFYIGSSTTRLSISYDYEAETYNRLNGYRKHIDERNACFARFSTKKINTAERRTTAAVIRTEHTRASKAVAKKHVITEEIFSRANQFFEAEDAFLADACKQTTVGRDNNAEDEENTEVTENVSEEVVVLRQRDESQLIKYTPESEKKMRPKITSHNLIKRIKTGTRSLTIGTVAQNIFDLFSIEIPIALLETVSLSILYQKNFFRRCVTVCLF